MYGYYQPYWKLNDDELEHFGIKGMKWGIRRYQNSDGTLTDAGKKRLENYKNKEYKIISREKTSYEDSMRRAASNRKKKGLKEDPKEASLDRNRLKMYDKELKSIMAMSYSDMKVEKKERVNGIIKSLLYEAPAVAMINTDNRITNLRIARYDDIKKKKL